MSSSPPKGGFARLWHEWDLTIVLLGLFVAIMLVQTLVGWCVYAEELADHGRAEPTLLAYLSSPHLWEALTENWESEFLQMAALVVFTVFLRQKGSPESKGLDERPGEEQAKEHDPRKQALLARPVLGRLYRHSLSLALLGLFGLSFIGHVLSGAANYNVEQRLHGARPVTALEFLGTPTMWFESTQNWQSEFLSAGLLVILTVYLREKGSSESKPVDEPDYSGNEE